MVITTTYLRQFQAIVAPLEQLVQAAVHALLSAGAAVACPKLQTILICALAAVQLIQAKAVCKQTIAARAGQHSALSPM